LILFFSFIQCAGLERVWEAKKMSDRKSSSDGSIMLHLTSTEDRKQDRIFFFTLGRVGMPLADVFVWTTYQNSNFE